MIVEYDDEPVRGLPGNLPPGERILWQGSPDWKRLAIAAYHVRPVAIYFGALVLFGGVQAARGIGTWIGTGITLAVGLACIALLVGIAIASARSTIYTLTNRRIVMRIGVALPKCINLPLRLIGSADLRGYRDGTGDIPLGMTGAQQLGWLQMWPHAKPWAINNVHPMLRCIPDAANVAGLIARTTGAAQGVPVTVAPQLAVAA